MVRLIHAFRNIGRGIVSFALPVVFFLLLSVNVAEAYNGLITIKVKNKPLKLVLTEIEKKTSYTFVYSSSTIDVRRAITLDCNNESLNSVLSKLCDQAKISYSIDDRKIMLSPLRESSSSSSRLPKPNQRQSSSSSQRLIKGKVLDQDGVAIPGASVIVKGTSIGTATNVDGTFSLNVPEGKELVVVSFIGYAPVEFSATDKESFQLALKPDAKRIDEVVVTGFQTLSKERATGAFAKVSSEELEKYSTTSLSQKLQASMNGVMVKPDGAIEIRGLSTLNTAGGKSDPLIVVDGFPIEGGLGSINPNDIENITILKDAAAASIYGIKSANGVIVITTKAGSKKKFMVDANIDYSVTEKPSLDYFDKMNANDAVDLQWDAYNRGFFDNTLANIYSPYSYVGQLYKEHKAGDASALDRLAKLKQYGNLTQHQYEDMLMRRSTTGQYGVSISGGSSNNQYIVSGKIEDGSSMYKGNDSKKFYLDSRIKLKLLENLELSVGLNTNYSKSNNNSPFSTSQYNTSVLPFEPLMVDGQLQALSQNSTPYTLRDKAKELNLLPAGVEYNPINDLNALNRRGEGQYNRYQVGLVYNLNMGLKFDLKYQYEDGASESKNIFSPETYKQASLINKFTEGTAPANLIYNIGKDKSTLQKNNTDWNSQLVRAMLTYNRSFSKLQQVTLFGGMEMQTTESNYNNEYYSSYDPVVGMSLVDVDKLTKGIVNWSGGPKQVYTISDNYLFNNSSSIQRNLSFFFNGSYSLLGKYNLTGSFRIDQSNIFGTDSKYRYKPMWSVGASWNLKKENFLSNVAWIDNLVFRTTYGLTGMIDKSTSPYIIISKDRNDYTGDYASFPNAPNPNLRWEQTQNLNVGVDYTLFNGRLRGFIDYYNKYTTDVIAPALNDPTNGFDKVTANTAEISNRGLDFSLTSLNVNRAITWSSTLNFSMNYNKIEKMYSNNGLDAYNFVAGTTVRQQFIAGETINQLYSYRWAGLDDQGNAQIYDRNGNVINGNDSNARLYKEDLEYSGSIQAPYFGSFNNTFTYGAFSLNVSILYKLGYYSRKNSIDHNIYSSSFANFYGDRWMKAGDENHTDIPVLTNSSASNNLRYYTYGSQNVFDASNIRLQYISLAYNVPGSFTKKLKLSDVTLRAQAENLGFIWRADKSGIDPNVHSVDGRRFGLPALRTFTFGISVKI